MVFVEIHGLWNGQLIFDNASVTQLADDLEDQQKQIITLTLQKMTASQQPPPLEPEEDASSFAARVGFTRLDYYYQKDNTWFVVDVLDSATRH
jgi:hypothetical protein